MKCHELMLFGFIQPFGLKVKQAALQDFGRGLLWGDVVRLPTEKGYARPGLRPGLKDRD